MLLQSSEDRDHMLNEGKDGMVNSFERLAEHVATMT